MRCMGRLSKQARQRPEGQQTTGHARANAGHERAGAKIRNTGRRTPGDRRQQDQTAAAGGARGSKKAAEPATAARRATGRGISRAKAAGNGALAAGGLAQALS